MSKLYPYQGVGASWLASRKRAMLLDEQGLGKTITAISAADLCGAKRVLAVCPTVVLWNWEAEFRKWSPARTVQVIDSGRALTDHGVDVTVVTHSLISSVGKRMWLLSKRFDLIILDEAHCFKTEGTKRTNTFYGCHLDPGEVCPPELRSLVSNSDRVWVMTGTPMPNNAAELWTHIHGLFPHKLKAPGASEPMTFEEFRDHFCVCRETDYGPKPIRNKNVEQLREILRGVSLRRLAKVVLPDLPPIRYETVKVKVPKLPWELPALRGQVKDLTHLFKESDFSGGGITPKMGFSALQDSSESASYRRFCGLAKVAPTLDILKMELAFGGLHKVVVFAHHSDVIDGLAEGFKSFGVGKITGSTPAVERSRLVAEFQNPAGSIRVMVCNIVAGGTGTTLTASHNVFFAEMSWVPGENAQAAKRCHRISQTLGVRVRCLVLLGTIDEQLSQSFETKMNMVRDVLQ